MGNILFFFSFWEISSFTKHKGVCPANVSMKPYAIVVPRINESICPMKQTNKKIRHKISLVDGDFEKKIR